jgi:UDP-N-acetylmuramate--alanine ligase
LFSRTRDFADDFAKSLSRLTSYFNGYLPARELPIKGITSEWLLDKIDNKHKEIVSKQDLIKTILESNAHSNHRSRRYWRASSINQRSVK